MLIHQKRNPNSLLGKPALIWNTARTALPMMVALLLFCSISPAYSYQSNSGSQNQSNGGPADADNPARGSIAALHSIRVVASTIDPDNSDQNPYGLVIVPSSAVITGKLKIGDLLVSNINNANNVMGLGTTVELIRPSDPKPAPVTFFNGAASPIAMVFNANATNLWIANYGLDQNGTQGNVDVVNNQGVLFAHGSINDAQLHGSWGQGFNGQALGGTVPPAFFDTNVLTGAVYRLQKFVATSEGPDFAGATITQIAALGHSGSNITNVFGPQGMVWSKINDTLYIADPVNNRIVAVPHPTTTGNVGAGYTVFQGSPLNQPAGLAWNPLNSDLLAVNQGDNKLIEIDTNQHRVVAVRLLDKTPVVNGVGSALFGLATTTDATGHLEVYFTDDNTNTVDVLSSGHKDMDDKGHHDPDGRDSQ